MYPPLLRKRWTLVARPRLAVIGKPDLLLRQSVGLICSRRCPGSVILKMYDFAQKLKLYDCVIAGGFQSPMERECLEVLMRGRSSLVFCPARGIDRLRPLRQHAELIEAGRMTIVSPFAGEVRRCTEKLAGIRNRFVAALASSIIIPHAARGSETDAIARELLALSLPVYTLEDSSNSSLLALGAQPLERSTIQPGLA